jgi:hypothetical protein
MSVQKSPKYSTFRISQGPSPDGTWRQRRATIEVQDMAKNWRSEMIGKIEKKLAEKASSQNDLSNLFHDAVSAVKKASETASEILATMRKYAESVREPLPPLPPLPPPFLPQFEPLIPLTVFPVFKVFASLFHEEIFTPEEIALEEKWVVPLVSFPEES